MREVLSERGRLGHLRAVPGGRLTRHETVTTRVSGEVGGSLYSQADWVRRAGTRQEVLRGGEAERVVV